MHFTSINVYSNLDVVEGSHLDVVEGSNLDVVEGSGSTVIVAVRTETPCH